MRPFLNELVLDIFSFILIFVFLVCAFDDESALSYIADQTKGSDFASYIFIERVNHHENIYYSKFDKHQKFIFDYMTYW